MKIMTNGNTASIGFNHVNGMMDCFIDIYVDGDIPSPFKNMEDAELFAEIILKLLNTILEHKYENGGKRK